MIVVCYMGGGAGDLVTSVIDLGGSTLNGTRMEIAPNRARLKKPHLFNNTTEKDHYIESMSSCYLSIPSHDTDYHIDQGHDFISVIVSDMPTAIWATTRFKNLHLPHVWKEMLSNSGVKDEISYAECMIFHKELVIQHTDKVIDLKNIRDGSMIEHLSKYVTTPLNDTLYNNWLQLQRGTLNI